MCQQNKQRTNDNKTPTSQLKINQTQKRNSYVKLYLLPDKNKSGKRKSSVHKGELNPKFDEKFTFGPALQLADFGDKVLWLSVWHRDRLSRNDFLGEILLPLSQVRQQLLSSDLCQSTGPIWYSLNERFDPSAYSKSRQQQHLIGTKGDLDANSIGKDAETKQLKTGQLASRSQQQQTGSGNLQTQNTMTIKRSEQLSKQQAQLVDKLNELQRKAAQLTSAVVTTNTSNDSSAPSNSDKQNKQITMNACLAPIYPSNQQQPFNLNNEQQLNQPNSITGQLFVALKFVPENNNQLISANKVSSISHLINGELQVIIKEAHNIGGFESPLILQSSNNQSVQLENQSKLHHQLPTGPLPNPFCKCYLLDSNGQRMAKQKTPYLKRTANPRWDYKCLFTSLKLSQLTCQAIEIQMFNRDSILVSNNEPLGGIRLCSLAPSYSTGSKDLTKQQDSTSNQGDFGVEDDEALCSEKEAKLWAQMLARPNIWVYGEFRLRLLRPLIPKTNFDN